MVRPKTAPNKGWISRIRLYPQELRELEWQDAKDAAKHRGAGAAAQP